MPAPPAGPESLPSPRDIARQPAADDQFTPAADPAQRPEDRSTAQARLLAWADGDPSYAVLATTLRRRAEGGPGWVELARAPALLRSLPPPATLGAFAGRINLLRIVELRPEEMTPAFSASLAALGTDALLLSRLAQLPPALGGLTREVYLTSSPGCDLATPAVRRMMREHPRFELSADTFLPGMPALADEFPGRVHRIAELSPPRLQAWLDIFARWDPDLPQASLDRWRETPLRERLVLYRGLENGECRRLFHHRPDFVANVRLLLRYMLADPAFRGEACAQIGAWSPLCADDWISCISTVLSSRLDAAPIADSRAGARRLLRQALLREVDRICAMRDPAGLPAGAWASQQSLSTETALMLRQAVDDLLEQRFGSRGVAGVPQVYAHYSAVDADEAAQVAAGLLERECRDGFPLTLQFSADSPAWKHFADALPTLAGPLRTALDTSLRLLEARPADEMQIQRDYLRQADALRAAPLREALLQWFPASPP